MNSATTLFLAFGKVSRPAEAMAREGQRIAGTGQPLGHQVALVSDTAPAFRFSTPGWLDAPPELIAALPDRAGLRLVCRDRLEAIVPIFAAAQRRWIMRYIDRLEHLCADENEDDGNSLGKASDRFFAALLPLPAVSLLPVVIEGETIRSTGPSECVAADLAFWDGSRLTAVFFGDENTAPPRARSRLQTLVEIATPLLNVRRVTTTSEAERLIDDMARAVVALPEPWFGPYRAPAFQAQLPRAV